MKHKYKEYIPPKDEERKRIWQNGVFVLDANVLLNLFRYSKKSSDELIEIINKHKDNLWLPYQVGMEFFNNRLTVISSINNNFEELRSGVSQIDSILEGGLKLNNFKADTALNTNKIREYIIKFRKNIEKKLNDWQKEFLEKDNDSILEEILTLYEGKVGDDYDTSTIEAIYKEGEKRYKDKIPPGFADYEEKKKKGDRHLYGDLIWWKQAMNYAKEKKRDLVIITDDRKDDWWYKVSGKIKSPRVELIREFDQETNGQSFLMYQTHQFMSIAKELDGADVSDSSIREAEETGSVDYNKMLNEYEMGYDPLDLNSEQPNTIFGTLPASHFNGLGYIPGRMRLVDRGMNGSLRGLVRPLSSTPEERIVLGQDLIDFFSKHPEGKLTYSKGTFVDVTQSVKLDDDKK